MPDPRATYRVQLNKSFDFHDAAALSDYLADLGISHVYCSPYLQARPGSDHGYDVVDPTRINDELGGRDGHRAFVDALHNAGLKHIVDFVPNHMAIGGRANLWWWDVLKHGRTSPFAPYFDIDWDPPERKLRGKVLMPILGDRYGRVLLAGDISIGRDSGEWVVRYHDHVLPLAPGSLMGEGTPDAINGHPDRLDALLNAQHYRLAFWRTALEELDYRRFFAINELVALRMDRAEVFHAVHSLILELIRAGAVEGLRIDHVDGLRDPRAYLERLRGEVGENLYIVVEKILGPAEDLPDWPVHGTSGYDFLNAVLGLFVDPAGEDASTATYRKFTGETIEIDAARAEKKLFMLRTELAPDLERLVKILGDVCEAHLEYRDFTARELREAVEGAIATFPVYRSYVDGGPGGIDPRDADRIERALEGARSVNTDIEDDLLALMRRLLTGELRGAAETDFAQRFQQTTAAAMAKGVEDTLFYSYNRFVALNEVGGDPARFGAPVERFHHHCRTIGERWPATLLATSTHDTKRGEDVRARLALLSEIPERWRQAVERWAAINAAHRTGELPDRNVEYLLYQIVVGAWPVSVERAIAYMLKAAREAKSFTSWTDPDVHYESALRAFVEGSLADTAFTTDLDAFVGPLVEPGWINSLSQVLLKLTAPGVPDIYQGSEIWDLSLVDPDNRRPVDYATRRELLDFVIDAGPEAAWSRASEGAPKLYLIRRVLAARRRFADSFGPAGAYRPISINGERSSHVVGFMRGDDVVVVAPRLVLGVGRAWGGGALDLEARKRWTDWRDTVVSWGSGEWVDELTDEEFTGEAHVAALFERFPVALLTRDDGS